MISLVRIPIGGTNFRRLFGNVEGVGRFGLHLERHLIRLKARFELRVLLEILAVQFVQLVHQVQLPALFANHRVLVANVFDELIHARHLRVNAHALEQAGQKR